MEPMKLKMKGPSESGNEEITPQRPATLESPVGSPVQEHRGIKRSRRERGGSSAKERISKMPACVPGKRSSIYRGVTRHRWTGRYEAHLWDKSTWNEAQNKKGKQVYLGAYDDEEAAARAYDLAALKYWGPGTLINFPVTDYARDVEEMQSISREDYLASLRRKGSGFLRGGSKFKGMTRHPSMGKWEARLGHILGHKYSYTGNPSSIMSQEDATAFDIQSLDYRGFSAGTNLDLTRYITWLRPEKVQTATTSSGLGASAPVTAATTLNPKEEEEGGASPTSWDDGPSQPDDQSQPEGQQSHQAWPGQASEPYQLPSLGVLHSNPHKKSSSPSALSLLLSSSIFKSMRERTSNSLALAAEIDTKYEPAAEIEGHYQFLQALHTSRASHGETSNEMFGTHLHYEMDSFLPSYGSSDRLGELEEAVAVSAAHSQGPSFSHSPTDWDPFTQPMTTQQLTSC
ncbi:AP2-like ethylene-responsive transcription factor SMOS1 [Physcomitrium patens]|uniref:AP2/ERF domain-containing protein n=1 Tax=Physcomitrium patens TaxID=3218 RepID=A0A2K1KI79_PHYPA|nr:AP2-like ethylene-responsive transcription factor At2g41710 [Physcomitrium patens]PNR53482.1 hypothetical protein PHYPA_007157 [Physcomitrium patens]|eukprot:XP_024376512.1 AP2-like ethylene-responsive transcription factor At2g41710 [Physcomitrella patens]